MFGDFRKHDYITAPEFSWTELDCSGEDVEPEYFCSTGVNANEG